MAGGSEGHQLVGVREDTLSRHDAAIKICAELCIEAMEVVRQDVGSNLLHSPDADAQFFSSTTLGMILNGFIIDSLLPGGPAWHSGALNPGMQIISVDGISVTEENLHALLLGDDVPRSKVMITVWHPATGEQHQAVLVRMATRDVAAMRAMFEPFAYIKEHARKMQDDTMIRMVDGCIHALNRHFVDESTAKSQIGNNVQRMQDQTEQVLTQIHAIVSNLSLPTETLPRQPGSPQEEYAQKDGPKEQVRKPLLPRA